MKGLVKKDLAILKIQKQFFLIIFIIGIMFLFGDTTENLIGAISYIVMITALFLAGTLSYDEFENGMPFLLTMPFTRREYIREKFIFNFIATALVTAIFSILSILITIFRGGSENMPKLLMSIIDIYMIACLFSAVIIPIQLKYGAEKKQIVLISIFVAVFAVIFAGKYFLKSLALNKQLSSFINSHENDTIVFFGIIILSCLFISILYKVSINIIEKKEY